jgi:hypothetical protein
MDRVAALEARSARHLYARVAGGAYLAIVLAAFVYGGLVESQLVVPGDDAVTAANILANPLQFRLGIVLVFTIYASVVVASWALFIVLRDVHENLALLALLFRMAEAVVGASTILTSFAVWYLLSAEGSASAFSPDELHALAGRLVDVRTAGLDIVLLFIGVGGTIFCYLLFRSRLIPRPLAAWGIFTYLSMLVLALVSILIPDHPLMLETVLYFAGGAFELIFGLWLLVKAVDA